ncbi:MAG: hypothetical protein P8012_14100, partial [Desulfobacterales bacterium]
MRNLKKELPALVSSPMFNRNLFVIIISLIVLAFHVYPSLLAADDNKRFGAYYKRHENITEHHDHDDHNRRRIKKDDEGNETTGQTAAWLLVAANLTASLSILIKGTNRLLPLSSQMKSSLKNFNHLQKKHLMRFHYVLNPAALGIAFFHF